MINLVLRNTTDTIYGRGSVSRVAELVKQHGGTKVLLHHVSEDFIKPLVKEIQELLENAGIATVDLGGVVPNPRLSTVYEGIELCRRERLTLSLPSAAARPSTARRRLPSVFRTTAMYGISLQ